MRVGAEMNGCGLVDVLRWGVGLGVGVVWVGWVGVCLGFGIV